MVGLVSVTSPCHLTRGGKIGPARWASPVRPKLGPGWAIKFLARKKPGQIWPGPVWPSPVWPGPPEFFFALKRLFGPIGPVFRAGWAVKILARKNRANFSPARFWPGPLLARPSPARPARLPPLHLTRVLAAVFIGFCMFLEFHLNGSCFVSAV